MAVIRKRKQTITYTESDSDFMSEEEQVSSQKKPKTQHSSGNSNKESNKKKTKDNESSKKKTKDNDALKKKTKDNDSLKDNHQDVVLTADDYKKSKLIIPRPKGYPFPDSILPESLEFIADLMENNDRDFMRIHAKEWDKTKNDFIDFCKLLMDEIHQLDPAVRVEQEAKNTIYRQHRDLRFSNDKRPYKENLSAGFSRQGRKFTDAGYYLFIKPNNQSFIAGGIWQPDSTRLQNIRSMIIRNGDLLREALSTDALKDMYDGKSGHEIMSSEDKLKVAPKNIAKDHPEIDLLRYKSFVLSRRFTDEDVVSPGFLDKVVDAIEAYVPFVTVINAWI